VDRDGRVYVADEFFRRVDVFRPVGLKPHEGHSATAAPATAPQGAAKPK